MDLFRLPFVKKHLKTILYSLQNQLGKGIFPGSLLLEILFCHCLTNDSLKSLARFVGENAIYYIDGQANPIAEP